ncbi:MAG: UbiA family prenyltransferase [Candidatus Tectomicrobia bacterium]|uniref:4-hydroxybenzoate polyprenyltransferase n=1 Tax=Tectimicrobiota bacterium TaxID=2528274 RepID=A0A932CMZ7_UNCTE|nr:UbiA family prenyltransferase [Candidatus Tectomicrobia bacterium]
MDPPQNRRGGSPQPRQVPSPYNGYGRGENGRPKGGGGLGLGRLWVILDDIKFQHTVFALPFALMSSFLAAQGLPPLDKLGWILLAMVGARSAAMAFNRMVDARYDRLNPRTQGWALPAGRIRLGQYLVFWLAAVLVFLYACARLNPLALKLSPAALGILLFYSLTKRFTVFSHFFLGASLGIAPIGAWVAIREEISPESLILGTAVTLWTAGFDLIYACQDIDFDRQQGLFSWPARHGIGGALWLSRLLHLGMVGLLLLLAGLSPLRQFYLLGVLLVAALLVYEHSLVKPSDLSRVNRAFFTVNGAVSLALFGFTAIDCLWYF